jgi:N-methylhydantoinase A
MLHADVGHYYSRTIGALLGDIDEVRLRDAWRDLEDAARLQLAADGFSNRDMQIGHAASLRYKGQASDIIIPLQPCLAQGPPLGLAAAFGDEHERSYGHRAGPDEPVQLVNIQVFGRGLRGGGEPALRLAPRRAEPKPPVPRAAFFGPRHGWLQTPVVRREALSAGLGGPCIVEEYDTTCLVPPGARASLAEDGNLVVEFGRDGGSSGGETR